METDLPALTWDQRAWDQMHAHCDREKPREACGALLGRPGTVFAIMEMTNTEPGTDHYVIDTEETLALFSALDGDETVELLGWYHSHPRTSSAPSDLDLTMAIPGWYYVVRGVDGVTTFSA